MILHYRLHYKNIEEGRLHKVLTNMHNAKTTAKLEAVYNYNSSDQISLMDYPSVNNIREEVYYTYNNRGWLTGINNEIAYEDGIIAVDMTRFSETLSYNNNGNISQQIILNHGNGNWPTLTFTYGYDSYNRLTSSTCCNSAYSESFLYDTHGNIINKEGGAGGIMDYFYVNNTNKLSHIKHDNNVNYYYTYDYRGNVTSDQRRGISNIAYDRRNLILSYNKSGSTGRYRYDDNGNRIFKNIPGQPKEYYLRDHTGKELAIYSNNKLKWHDIVITM